jgi:hypothetical protein
METPFDNLIYSLRQLTPTYDDANSPPNVSEVFQSVHAFSKITRVLYCNMTYASKKMKVFTDAAVKENSSRTLSLQETLELYDFPIRCKVSYMQFIEHINRSGRFFKKMGFTPPLYERIRFFRNKVVEHVDLYMKILTVSYHDELILSSGKIAIPYAFAGISKPNRTNLQQELTDAFAQCCITLPSLEGVYYGEYSNIIYAALENIDSKLRRFNEEKRIGIPESIVTLLFKYSFPTPICDMEEYCKTLVEWLEMLPIQ